MLSKILNIVFLLLPCFMGVYSDEEVTHTKVQIFKAGGKPDVNGPDFLGYVQLSLVDGKVYVNGTLKSLAPGKHGFHVHEFGSLDNSCIAAGAHFNPYNKSHGAPEDEERHLGDLGNIEADANGEAVISITDQLIKLSGPNNVMRKSIVIHEKPDDMGKGNHNDSKTTGHSGKRIACGIIGSAQDSGSGQNSIKQSFFTIMTNFLIFIYFSKFL